MVKHHDSNGDTNTTVQSAVDLRAASGVAVALLELAARSTPPRFTTTTGIVAGTSMVVRLGR